MSQEIWDDLGQLGSLVLLGTMVAQVDGEVAEEEGSAIVQTFLQFAPDEHNSKDDLFRILDKVMNAHKSLGTFENKIDYALTTLNTFKAKFNADTRKAILGAYNDIAMADLEMHPNEAALLGLYAKHLL